MLRSQCHDLNSAQLFFQQHLISYLPILDEEQKLLGVIDSKTLMPSLTPKLEKQAEERLAQSENLLRTIIESEPECVKILGRDGRLLEMNPAGLAMIEADSLAEVIDKPVYTLINPNHRRAFIELTKSIFKGESGKLEVKRNIALARNKCCPTQRG
jgi:PAS domain-containing protein